VWKARLRKTRFFRKKPNPPVCFGFSKKLVFLVFYKKKLDFVIVFKENRKTPF